MKTGNDRLIEDLEYLLKEAKNNEFDDFKNEKYPNPKMELVAQLNNMITDTIGGKYD